MSVTLTWIADGVNGSDAIDRRTHTRTLLLISTSDLTSVTALQSAGVPAYGDQHPSAPSLKVIGKTARPLGSGYEWLINIEYGFESPTAGGARTPTTPTVPDEIPTNEPWEVSQDYMDMEIVPDAMMEVSGAGGNDIAAADPSVNTAGEAFRDPVRETLSCNVIVLEKNLASGAISPSTAETYQGSVNSSAITVAGISIGKRCGLMRRCAVQKRYYGDTPTAYWRLRVEIVVYPASITTDIAVLQQGYNKLDGSDLKPIRNADGTEVRVPHLLDANGAPTTTSTFRYFARSKRVAWSGLGLPSGA